MNTSNTEFEPKHHSIAGNILFFIRHYKRYEPAVLWICAGEILLGSLLPLFYIYLPKITIDLAAEKTAPGRLLFLLGGFTLLLMLLEGLKSGLGSGKYNLYNTQRTNLVGMLFLKSLRIKYEYTESGPVKKMYMKACRSVDSGDWSASSRMVSESVSLLINILSFLLYSTVIGYLSPGMLLTLLLLSALNYLISMGRIRFEESLREEDATAQKHYQCIYSSMGNMKGAKDIRIFGMQHWLLQLRDHVLGELRSLEERRQRKNAFYEWIGILLSAVRDLGAYAYLLYRASCGTISSGEFVLYFGAVTGFSGFMSGIMGALASLRGAANSTDYIRAYLDLPEEDLTSGNTHINTRRPPLEIEFRDVCFSYKESEGAEGDTAPCTKEIFRDLNLKIRQGEKIALVGINGAGKTTLVKLLCGIYDPDQGQILINGIDRRKFPKTEYYRLFSVVFQEQLILPFTVGENLAMDRMDQVNEEKAWEALDKAGLKQTFLEKGIGIRSYMTKVMMEDGVELSGGQQQRFLLARALYKDAPVLVLDEPTAALDPLAEREVYQHYNQYSQGKTALFISHRLASTRFSDRILLLENGRIAESGTHRELMQAGGSYAKMYEIQSSYYTGGDPDGIQFDR